MLQIVTYHVLLDHSVQAQVLHPTDAQTGYFATSYRECVIVPSTSETACAIGTYQDQTGQSSCDNADAGYFVSASAASSQTPCAAGKYQPLGGQSSCTDVEAGYYSPGTTTLNGVVTEPSKSTNRLFRWNLSRSNWSI